MSEEFQRIYIDIRKSSLDRLRSEKEKTGIPYKRMIENAIEKAFAPKQKIKGA